MTKIFFLIFVPIIIASILLSGGPVVAPFTAIPNGERGDLTGNTVLGSDKTLQIAALLPDPCTSGKVAVDFLLDASTSMKNNNRLQKMKDSVVALESQLPDDSVVGAQWFSNSTKDLVAIDTKANNAQFTQKVQGLQMEGGTNTKNGVLFAKSKIEAGKQKFPGYAWYLIVVTDGAPHPYPKQDPRPVIGDVKGLQIHVITVGMELSNDSKSGVSKVLAEQILRETATSPSDFYEPSLDQLQTLFQSLSGKFCGGIIKTTPQPTQTPQVNACTNNNPIFLFVLDASDSMHGKPIESLKTAVTNFVQKLPDDAVFGMIRFPPYDSAGGVDKRYITGPAAENKAEMIVNFDTLVNNRQQFTNNIAIITQTTLGTPTKSAFMLAKNKLTEVAGKYPNSSVTLIFLSDGEPTEPKFLDTVNEIKQQFPKIKIISIGYRLAIQTTVTPMVTSAIAGLTLEQIRQNMISTASTPSDYYDATENQIDTLFSDLLGKICHQ